MTLTFGFIGAGTINRVHMGNAHALGLTSLAVADHDPAALARAAGDFGIPVSHGDYRDLLRDQRIDAVVIASPNCVHAEHAIAALDAGKHVLLEKPMAMNAEECRRIIAAMHRNQRMVQIGMSNRFKAAPQALRDLIAGGSCGVITSAQASWFRRRGIPGFGGWATQQCSAGGGCLIDIGVHMLDLVLYLMDFPTPVSVSGMVYNTWPALESYVYTSMWGVPVPGGRKDVEDSAMAQIRFQDGQILQLGISWAINLVATPHEQSIRVMGDRGGVELRGLDDPYLYTESAGRLVDIRPVVAPLNEFAQELSHFADSIRHGTPPTASAAQGLAVQVLMDAIYASAASGREVLIPAAEGEQGSAAATVR